ncbi:MAG: polysaccharide deacetylase [Candidatus Scalindua rubra]|uniref:Polysaccharide deacetylase n=1 Tax=Candidatus Scalindua rubra TaxID=1872076 RepID=A0A1E3XG38_9BACT|nr:MAG: polysaccharide deacetylase [Candidatus Scalindua rubra]
MNNILTIDVEDWYQSSIEIIDPESVDSGSPIMPGESVVYNTRRLISILAEYGVHATCFILGTVAEKFPELIREIRNAGHEIATHGYGHQLLYKLTPDLFRIDLKRSIKLLESLTDRKVCGYRAPYFSITPKSAWAFEILGECSIDYDSSIFPIRHKLYGFPGIECFPHKLKIGNRELCEFPISTISVLNQKLPVGGGGYFRIFPYSFIKRSIKKINSLGKAFVFYLHPYELDVEELKNPLVNENIRLRWIRLTQDFKRNTVETKLRKLLTDFQFTSIEEWLRNSTLLSARQKFKKNT